MLRKTLCVLVLFIFIIQEINGRPPQNPTKPSPLQEAIQKINPELDKITLRLKELKLQIYKSLLQSFTETHGTISKFGSKILEAINQLQYNTSEITKIANKSDINIEPCLSRQQATLERVLMVANSKTNKISEENQVETNNFTEKANNLVREAEDIDKNINKIIGYCIRQNNLAWQQEKLIECLFNEASYVNKKVDQLYQQKDLINSEKNTLANNITTNQDNLLKWISTLQAEFLKCISESEIYLNVPNHPQEATFLGNEDTKMLRKPDKVGTSHHNSTETNTTIPVNLDQQLKIVEYQFGQPQRIFEKIRRLEFLFGRLKQLHEFKDKGNVDKISFFRKDEFNLHQPGVSLNPVNFEKNKLLEPPQQNRRFILYISL